MAEAPYSRSAPDTPLSREREIRLAFLLGRIKRGGAELQMIRLTRGLTQLGYRVDFVCRSGEGPLDDLARSAGARVQIIGELFSADSGAREKYSQRARKNLRWVRIARRERYDIVDAWLHPSYIFAALSRPLTGIPVVLAGRLNRRERLSAGPATPLLNSIVNRLTDVVVANADVTAADAVQEEGVPLDRVRVIRGGVELPRPLSAADRRKQRASLGAADGDFLIGCVGNFRTMKRQDLLIDAFSRLLPEHSSLRLVLVGDGELRPQIERQIAALGLKQRVVLTGSVSDLPPLYDAFDLYVQASNSESLPNVLLEASASSLPIVATAAGGSNEVVHDGETGLLVPVDDLELLTSALRRAIGDAGLRHRIGAAARELVEREYGMERFIREYDGLYRGQLRARGVL